MAEKDYSLQAFNGFLDYLSSKHLLNKNTAQSRKAAVNKVLQVLDATEASDLRQVDMEMAFQRFANKDGRSYKPDSLMVYKSRLTSALTDFYSYVENPAQFRPSVKSSSGTTSKKRSKPAEKGDHEATPPGINRAQEDAQGSQQHHKPPSDGLTIPVPLREGLTVKIAGIPFDLTEAEASRLASIIKAYAAQ